VRAGQPTFCKFQARPPRVFGTPANTLEVFFQTKLHVTNAFLRDGAALSEFSSRETFSKQNSSRFAKDSLGFLIQGEEMSTTKKKTETQERHLGGTFWNSRYLHLLAPTFGLLSREEEIPATEIQVVACERHVGTGLEYWTRRLG
jgi:hypothetical protein